MDWFYESQSTVEHEVYFNLLRLTGSACGKPHQHRESTILLPFCRSLLISKIDLDLRT